MPLETRSICYHADRIVVDMRHAFFNLDNDLFAGTISNPPMYRGFRTVATHERDDSHLIDVSLYFLYSSELRQDPRHQLQVGNRRRIILLIIKLIAAEVGIIEQTCRESGFIKSFGNKFFFLNGETHITILGFERHTVFSLRCK